MPFDIHSYFQFGNWYFNQGKSQLRFPLVGSRINSGASIKNEKSDFVDFIKGADYRVSSEP